MGGSCVLEGMRAHAIAVLVTVLAQPGWAPPAAADDGDTTLRAALDRKAGAVRLTVTSGRKAGARLDIGKTKPSKLFDGDAVGTVEAGHDRVVVALSIDDGKRPFRIVTVDGGKLVNPLSL